MRFPGGAAADHLAALRSDLAAWKAPRPMRILVLSWEYPPRVVGGLGRHVHALTRSLVEQGHQVHVVTRDHPDAPPEELVGDVHVTRVSEAPPVIPFDDLVAWVLAFNNRVQSAAARIVAEHDVDVIHAHDWLVAYAAAGLKDSTGVPLVATVHATEYGRHQGYLPGPMNKLIHQIEWWLTYEARRVVTCSAYMREQVSRIFELPADKVDVIPNGVAVADFALPDAEVAAFRRTLTPDGEKLVLFAGRLEYEKGVQTVLHAIEHVQDAVGPVRVLIAGVGTYSQELRRLVDELEVADRVRFTGFLEDHALRLHYAAADVAVAPSIYEPFGLVAVEAMACGTPVVVGDTGGLREIVADGHGLSFPPQDERQLAGRLVEVLSDPSLVDDLVERGRDRIQQRYDWGAVARATVAVYARAVAEERRLREAGAVEDRRPLRAILHDAEILELDGLGG
ncbi:glycosyltransferase family 4 protein [Nitriliruptoraceae bacterium ZYF776]|nr:glycosyltransferase family 4 protein [Profundirhabdus halotolerans]